MSGWSAGTWIAAGAIAASLVTFAYMFLSARRPRAATGTATTWRPMVAAGAALTLAMALGWSYTTYAIRTSQAAQEKVGQAVNIKICHTLQLLASDQPPAGNPANNPSRAYLQRLHADLAQLAGDLGCKRGR